MQVPLQTIVGNHEIEPQFSAQYNTSKVKFVSYSARYPMPHLRSGSPDPNYYSYDVGGVHFVAISSYVDFQKSSPQYKWLESDLKRYAAFLFYFIFVNAAFLLYFERTSAVS